MINACIFRFLIFTALEVAVKLKIQKMQDDKTSTLLVKHMMTVHDAHVPAPGECFNKALLSEIIWNAKGKFYDDFGGMCAFPKMQLAQDLKAVGPCTTDIVARVERGFYD